MGFYKYTQGHFSNGFTVLGGVVFICLVPFWLRTAEFQYEGFIVLPYVIAYFYAGVAVISGIWLFLGCARMIDTCKIDLLKNFLILCGQLSLGNTPCIIFSWLIRQKLINHFLSLIVSFLLNKIPVIRNVFLGER